ncbi:hypothetical protein [Alicyclobacillus sp. ALC3]|nr:hypothetical protein [Alicyclobacillus sp. ALC3]
MRLDSRSIQLVQLESEEFGTDIERCYVLQEQDRVWGLRVRVEV